MPVRVRVYVGAIVLLAALAVLGATLLAKDHDFNRPWLVVGAVLFGLQGLRAIRRRKGSEGETTTHEEALFVFLALLMPPLPALATFALGVVAGRSRIGMA